MANIDQIEETTIKWIQWSGQGWRLKSLKHIGYITGNGLGIHLVLNTGREYTFNCAGPSLSYLTECLGTSIIGWDLQYQFTKLNKGNSS